ncbi:MAG TPA: DUF1045 domain-containing protein, partial [Desulfobulbus sp.]|nr:DUF1045 domain-containing protein [Desulfobulbus sp.]
TRKPRKYGPHATLKAPFHLRQNTSVEDLHQAISDFCRQRHSFVLPPLILSRINSFFCLVPSVESPRLNDVAAACVQEFDCFRAPLTLIEQARRKAAILTEKELQYLESWGYPHVFDRYRFHITLTSRLTDRQEVNQVFNLLEQTFSDVLNKKVLFDGISLLVEPGPGKKLRLLQRFPLDGPLLDGEKEDVKRYEKAGS